MNFIKQIIRHEFIYTVHRSDLGDFRDDQPINVYIRFEDRQLQDIKIKWNSQFPPETTAEWKLNGLVANKVEELTKELNAPEAT